jgi:ATP-dependent Clp protease ATP-binding subunit ClpX
MTRDKEATELLDAVTPEDVLEFGLIPELVGRLPIVTPLMPLSRDAMVRILTEPKNALVQQYQHLFSLEGTSLEFTEEALLMLADRALERETGARALRAVLDEFMLDLMYDLPDIADTGCTYVIDTDAINEARPRSELVRRKAKESA